MDKVLNKCPSCCKQDVCKYIDDMNKLTESINEKLSYLNSDLPFYIKRVECDYFCIKKDSTIRGV